MTPILDPSTDFQDDGGTPEWRRRHAAPPLIIVPRRAKGFRAWWRRSSPTDIYLAALVAGTLFFVAYFIAALAALCIYDAIT